MGPYDNETSSYVDCLEVREAHWLVDNATDALYIVPRQSDGFEIFGPDEREEELNALPDNQLVDDLIMSERGFTLIYPFQRRFNVSNGYYYA